MEIMFFKFLKLIFLLCLPVLLLAGCSSQSNNAAVKGADQYLTFTSFPTMPLSVTNTSASKYNKYSAAPSVLAAPERMNKQAVFTTDKGVITIKLFGDEAPLAVSNFIFLIKDKFYDGLTFHRREEGFVIQGGDPLGQGFGGPGYQFNDEPVTRKYTRGIVAMANSGPNTNGSQFFIMLADAPLPPSYTIFGEVIKGMDVVDKIQVGDKINKAEIADL